ncbi:fatty-acid--CoA ligase FadD4 [Mycobacterium sp.]|uniref:fatty-acid--CoA ligase FadD4 n=1 Tax=Mycobacterium sp. TaxID=1785 RepID=UPI003D103943
MPASVTFDGFGGSVQVRIHAALEPNRPAIILYPSAEVVTFGALEARANRLAHYFRRSGLREGDAIAILMENNEHIHAIMWAARRSGLYYVPINTHLTAAEAAYIVDNSSAVAVIGSAALRGTLKDLANHLPRGLPNVLLIADDDMDGWLRYPECVADQPTTPIDAEHEGELLQYSSGTTGQPKGIKRELTGLVPADAPNLLSPLLSAMGIDRTTVYLGSAPLYHTAPSMWSMCVQAVGGTVVVMEKFEAEGCLHAIQQYRVTHGQFVPAMFVRMLKLSQSVRDTYDVSTLVRVVHAAAPCPVQIKKQMIDWWGAIVDEFYASSEGAGITYITADDWLARPGSVGRPMLGTAHIIGEDGDELVAGQAGEIYFEGGHTFEYLKDQTKTSASKNAHGWVTVGDIGYLDEEGYLFLTDRRHHMIISGGVNIYPQEAENMLVTHPKVMDAAVFGIPHDEMGQCVKAVVQTVDPADATDVFADELQSWLRGRLTHYKCPQSISFEAQLPRTDAGKLYKQELVKKYSGV